jgi:hypothetical protein
VRCVIVRVWVRAAEHAGQGHGQVHLRPEGARSVASCAGILLRLFVLTHNASDQVVQHTHTHNTTHNTHTHTLSLSLSLSLSLTHTHTHTHTHTQLSD